LIKISNIKRPEKDENPGRYLHLVSSTKKKIPDLNLTKQLKDFIYDGRVVMIGPIRQELFSGISNPPQFNKLKQTLSL